MTEDALRRCFGGCNPRETKARPLYAPYMVLALPITYHYLSIRQT